MIFVVEKKSKYIFVSLSSVCMKQNKTIFDIDIKLPNV